MGKMQLHSNPVRAYAKYTWTQGKAVFLVTLYPNGATVRCTRKAERGVIGIDTNWEAEHDYAVRMVQNARRARLDVQGV